MGRGDAQHGLPANYPGLMATGQGAADELSPQVGSMSIDAVSLSIT
jgi:hypothetical protein